MSGCYYVIDELMSTLSYQTVTNYFLSVLTGRVIKLSRTQYLRHFADTALLLKENPQFHIILHHSPMGGAELMWYSADTFAIAVKHDEYSGRIKFMFEDTIKTVRPYHFEFQSIYMSSPSYRKDNEFVSSLFERISRGENPGIV